jgi:polyferredoxin
MDPEEYEKIFGYLSDKKYPNDIKESEEKRRIRTMSYKFVIEGSDLFYWNLFHSYGIYFTVMESISQLWNLFHSYGNYFTR